MNRATRIRERRRLLESLGASDRRLRGAIEDALTHYWVGLKTAGVGLPTDWSHVAQRMAETLERALDAEDAVEEATA